MNAILGKLKAGIRFVFSRRWPTAIVSLVLLAVVLFMTDFDSMGMEALFCLAVATLCWSSRRQGFLEAQELARKDAR